MTKQHASEMRVAFFSKYPNIVKVSVSMIMAAAFVAGGSINNAKAYVPTSVFVDGIQQIANASSTAAVADGNYDHGWRWVFYVTVLVLLH